ncbi:hypothetical protein KSC_034110 [Ktedonobacter sp. SOSP1-52]|nr:hypothetical protein KSC_034110 [Ktedonobacter sp. SOSP1-52]
MTRLYDLLDTLNQLEEWRLQTVPACYYSYNRKKPHDFQLPAECHCQFSATGSNPIA